MSGEARDGGREVSAIVVEQLPNALYRLALDGRGGEVLAHVVERRRNDFLRLLPGDRVRVRIAPDDDRRGRILKKEAK